MLANDTLKSDLEYAESNGDWEMAEALLSQIEQSQVADPKTQELAPVVPAAQEVAPQFGSVAPPSVPGFSSFGAELLMQDIPEDPNNIRRAELLKSLPSSDLKASDLEEFGGAPELNEFSLASLKASLAGNLINNDAELAVALADNIPGTEITKDTYGNPLVKFPSGKTYAVNKPGLTGQDFIRFVTRVLGFTPATRGLTGIGPITLGKSAARAGATELGLQGVEAGLGGKVDVGEVAIAAAAAPVGQVIGEKIISPILSGAGGAIKSMLAKGKEGIANFNKSVEQMSDEGAATLLAEKMAREGLTPDDVAKKLAELGPDAVPADVGDEFGRLLMLAGNKVPRIQAEATRVMDARQKGQSKRITEELEDIVSGQPLFNKIVRAFNGKDDVPILSAKDEIIRLNQATKPEIDRLYALVRENDFILDPKLSGLATTKKNVASQKLIKLLKGDNELAKAFKSTKSRVDSETTLSNTPKGIRQVDAAKQELDDQINKALRDGENNKVSRLVRFKNTMLEEVDKAIPVYKEARNLFAGKAQLENAVEAGEMFLKMKPDEVSDFIKNASASEMNMYRLGAKKAIIDKMDTIQLTHDAVARLFGQGGAVKKIQKLFESEKGFKSFSDMLKREAHFVMTRRAAQRTSGTPAQIMDDQASAAALTSSRAAMGDPLAAADMMRTIVGGINKKKGSEAYVKALEKAGDFLLESGMDAKKIVELLERGKPEQIKQVIKIRAPSKVKQAIIAAELEVNDDEQ